MGFTNKTANYGLPQYVGADRPKILTDVNDAYAEIDKQMKANADAAAAATAAAGVAQSAAEAASSKAETAQSTAETSQEGIDNVKAIANNALDIANVADHHADLVMETVGQGSIDSVNSTKTLTGIIGNNSIAGIGDGTVSGALNSLAGGTTAVINTDNIPYTEGIGGTETTTLTGALEATSTHISSINSEIVNAKSDITTLNTEMGTADISAIGDGTVKGAIASLETQDSNEFEFDFDHPILSETLLNPSTSQPATINVNLTNAHYVVLTSAGLSSYKYTVVPLIIPAWLFRNYYNKSERALSVPMVTDYNNASVWCIYYDGSNLVASNTQVATAASGGGYNVTVY